MPVFLNIEKTTDDNLGSAVALFLNASHHVDMHQKAYSDDSVLFSEGFANCIAVIVHDADLQRGCLMHIYPLVSGGLNQKKLFDFVDIQIEAALNQFADSKNIQIFLWKGISYAPMLLNKIEQSYADYAKERFAGRASIIDMLDKGRLTSEASLIYSPVTGSVYLVAPQHESSFSSAFNRRVQGSELQREMVRPAWHHSLSKGWMRFWRGMRACLPVSEHEIGESRRLLNDR
jgi:hypothetical protein